MAESKRLGISVHYQAATDSAYIILYISVCFICSWASGTLPRCPVQIKHTLIYKIMAESKRLGISVRYQPATNKTYTNIQNNG